MAVYVDDVRHRYGNMVMCHLWADTLEELLAMVDRIGVQRKWLQQPPKASWVHFDIALSKKALALQHGAVLTDKYGPVEHLARLAGNQHKLNQIAQCRLLPRAK
jgi:hypothetical protein